MNLASPILAPELRFILQMIFQYLIGWLIASGYLDAGVRDQLVSQAVDFTGFLIIAITSGIGLVHLARTSHKVIAASSIKPVVPEKVEPTIPSPAVDVTVLDGGTPVSKEQVLSSAKDVLGTSEQ